MEAGGTGGLRERRDWRCGDRWSGGARRNWRDGASEFLDDFTEVVFVYIVDWRLRWRDRPGEGGGGNGGIGIWVGICGGFRRGWNWERRGRGGTIGGFGDFVRGFIERLEG